VIIRHDFFLHMDKAGSDQSCEQESTKLVPVLLLLGHCITWSVSGTRPAAHS
jgi:hypothetical protein